MPRTVEARSPRGSSFALPLLCAWLIAAAVSPVQAQSPLQISPDGRRVLVQRDVNDERWAIAYDTVDGNITGNVFRPGGGAAAFISCQRTGDDGNPDPRQRQIRFQCFGADDCRQRGCNADQWAPLNEVVLPGSFFLPVEAASDVVPTDRAALFQWLIQRRYSTWPGESGVHSSSGPHGRVRSFINPVLEASLAAASSTHPVGAAAVKELYTGDGSTLRGWAVEVKTQPNSSGGAGWYWYEVFDLTDGATAIGGQGFSGCTGCHASGRDFVLVPFPLQ